MTEPEKPLDCVAKAGAHSDFSPKFRCIKYDGTCGLQKVTTAENNKLRLELDHLRQGFWEAFENAEQTIKNLKAENIKLEQDARLGRLWREAEEIGMLRLREILHNRYAAYIYIHECCGLKVEEFGDTPADALEAAIKSAKKEKMLWTPPHQHQ